MSSPRSEFLQGMRDISPVLPGVLPFGLIAGVTAVSVGLSIVQTIGMSIFVVAGASQLAALELIQNGSIIGIILLTVAMINIRHMMYSATIAPHFVKHPLIWRLFLPYLLIDQVFLFASLRYNREPEMPYKRAYYLGLATMILTGWHSATIIGALLGTQIPPAWGLDFVIPLVFM
ncbi:MAG: AzlC family ABC transporter permease, partial [Chloroflexota bacterium]